MRQKPGKPGGKPAGKRSPGPGGPGGPGKGASGRSGPGARSSRSGPGAGKTGLGRAKPASGAKPGAKPAFGAKPGAKPASGAKPGAKPASGAKPGAKPAFGAKPGAKPAFGARPGAKPAFGAKPGAKPAFGAKLGAKPGPSARPKPTWAAEGESRGSKSRAGKGVPGAVARPKGKAKGAGDAADRLRAAPREAAMRGDNRPRKPLRDRAEAQAALSAAEAGRDLDLDFALEAETAPARKAALAAEAAEAAEAEIVWGKHAVLEALKGERHVNKVWVLRGLEDARFAGNIRRLAREKGAVLQEVERGKLNELAPATHQGVVASLAPVAYADFEDIVTRAKGQAHPVVLVLDGIEDPHNLGALIRTAGAAGAHGVVIPRRRAVGLTGTVAKAAAGALEHVPVARVNNLVQALESLKKAGFWVVGADQDAPKLAYEADLRVPLAIVVGAEGPGVSRLTADKCDLLVRFPMEGAVPSLNASVAGALLLFEVVRQRNAV